MWLLLLEIIKCPVNLRFFIQETLKLLQMKGHESNGNKCKLYLSELYFVISRISSIVFWGVIAIGYHLGRAEMECKIRGLGKGLI